MHILNFPKQYGTMDTLKESHTGDVAEAMSQTFQTSGGDNNNLATCFSIKAPLCMNTVVT